MSGLVPSGNFLLNYVAEERGREREKLHSAATYEKGRKIGQHGPGNCSSRGKRAWLLGRHILAENCAAAGV